MCTILRRLHISDTGVLLRSVKKTLKRWMDNNRAVMPMGYVRVRGIIANPLDRSIKEELEFIADTGAIYTVIPESVANRLKLEEVDRRRFKTASGKVVEYPVSEAYITIEERGVTSLVAIANEKTPILLGVTTLELLGLQVDPVSGRLIPLELMIL
ncbi:MAG: retroviral-like aspartic protease family protein [Candidatus Bathyarchaeia archaeon]